MVAAVRRGQSLRAVAEKFGVGVATVALWVRRAQRQRLGRVERRDRPRAPHRARRADAAAEERVLRARRAPAEGGPGAVGAGVVRRGLLGEGLAPVPSVRATNRILGRRGALGGRRRTRRPAPPRGWYLPDVAGGEAGPDCADVAEGLAIKGGPQVEVLSRVALHGGLAAPWPVATPVTADATLGALVGHWREVGLPRYAQFDDDPTFRGTHRWPGALGRVVRLCLSLAVVPVFVPPAEVGPQAMIESHNGWWQRRRGRGSPTPTWGDCGSGRPATCRRCAGTGQPGSRRRQGGAPSRRGGPSSRAGGRRAGRPTSGAATARAR